MLVTFYETFVHCCRTVVFTAYKMSQIETKLPVGLKCCDFCSLRRVDEGKFSGGLMIRRVARGKEKEKVVKKRAMVAPVWCVVVVVGVQVFHVVARVHVCGPHILRTTREKSAIRQIQANSRQTLSKWSQSGTA